MRKTIMGFCTVAVVVLSTLVLNACGGGSGSSSSGGTTSATVVLGSPDSLAAPLISGSGFVSQTGVRDVNIDIGTIDSFTIDITKVTVHHAGSDDDSEEEEDVEEEVPDESLVRDHEGDEHPEGDEGEDDSTGGWITIFEAMTDEDVITLDLVTLQTSNGVIASANLPVGKYTKLVLYYENPTLTYDDGGAEPVVTTNIKRTANGRLFVSRNFTLELGEPAIISLALEPENGTGFFLVDTEGSQAHDFVSKPQLTLSVNEESASVEIEGEIAEVIEDPQGITVDSGDAIFDVTITSETIIVGELPEVEEPPESVRTEHEIPLTFEDLEVG